MSVPTCLCFRPYLQSAIDDFISDFASIECHRLAQWSKGRYYHRPMETSLVTEHLHCWWFIWEARWHLCMVYSAPVRGLTLFFCRQPHKRARKLQSRPFLCGAWQDGSSWSFLSGKPRFLSPSAILASPSKFFFRTLFMLIMEFCYHSVILKVWWHMSSEFLMFPAWYIQHLWYISFSWIIDCDHRCMWTAISSHIVCLRYISQQHEKPCELSPYQPFRSDTQVQRVHFI